MATCSAGANVHAAKTKANYGPIKAIIFDQIDTEISYANILLEATWITKYNAIWGSRAFPLIITQETQVTREVNDQVLIDTNVGGMIKSTDGKRVYIFDLGQLPLCHVNKIKAFDSVSGYGWFVHQNGYIPATDTGTGFKPVQIQIFVDNVDFGENTEDFVHLKLRVEIIPRSNYFTKTAEIIAFNPLLKEGVINLELSNIVASAAASTVIFDATAECDSCREITTMVTAGDWIVEDVTTGITQTPATLTKVNNRYTLTGVTVVNGVDYYLYRKTADQATDKGYETRSGSSVEKTTFIAVA